MEEKMEEKKQSEGIGIVGFILAFLFPLIGLILSIVGIVNGKKNNNGIGFAIAGAILSSLAIFARALIVLLLVFVFKSVDFQEAFDDQYDKLCSNVQRCDKYLGEGFYSCSYSKGNVNYNITCREESIPSNALEDAKGDIKNDDIKDLNEIKHLAEKYYIKMYDGVYEESKISIIEDNKIKIKIYSRIGDLEPAIIITVDRDTLIGKDSQGYYVDLNEIDENSL